MYVKVDPVNGDKYGPRPINAIFLSSGSRADVAIKCSPGGDNMIQLARGVEDFDPDLYGELCLDVDLSDRVQLTLTNCSIYLFFRRFS